MRPFQPMDICQHLGCSLMRAYAGSRVLHLDAAANSRRAKLGVLDIAHLYSDLAMCDAIILALVPVAALHPIGSVFIPQGHRSNG